MQGAAIAAPPPLRQTQIVARHLDLSAPAHPIETSYKVPATEQGRFTILGADSMHAQPTVQDRVRLFRREGLPVARLWENNSTLLHLGLNQKGKPGLWLVQKTH